MSGNFAIETPVFQGPLEALLDLIEARKLPISQVSLADVCDAYLAFVEKLPEMPLAETSQFVLIASTLLLIKSRSLLPVIDLSDDERESVEELERRLKRLAAYRQAAKTLKGAWGKVPLSFAGKSPARPVVFAPAETSTDRILSAVRRVIQTLPTPAKLGEASVAPVVRLEDVIKDVHARLTTAIRTKFSELTKKSDRSEVIVYFLAMLELVRSGSASVTQDRLFSDITIELEQVGVPRFGA